MVKARALKDKWDAERTVVRAALLLRIASPELTAVIADERDDGVVEELLFLECLQDRSDGFVDLLNAAIVIGQLLLPVAGGRS